ncbi:MAG: hypothetical protein ABJA78_07115 [Ferruginibacter sp.]
MHSAKLTTAKYLLSLFTVFGLQFTAHAQENSPYSRYGVGDLTPNQNVVNRAMGGIAAGYLDNVTAYQSLNSVNPATYSNLSIYAPFPFQKIFNTVFELGAEADIRSLKSASLSKKFTNTNALFSYLQIGFPLASKKMERKGINWGMVLGFKPVSRINYNIEKDERLAGIDSLKTVYQGSGGLTQAFIGTGFKYKNFSFGINTGYMFGNKDYSTRLTFINDTVSYYASNSANKTSIGGVFLNAGIQYLINTGNKGKLVLGAYGSLKQNLKASQDIVRETFVHDATSNADLRIDSVYESNNNKGTMVYPSTFGAGFTYQDGGGHWLAGVDYEATNWSEYRLYGQQDFVQNTWTIRGGVQYLPAKRGSSANKYFNFVKYRAGFNYSPGYIKLGGNNLPEYSGSIGAGFPLTGKRIGSEYVVLNTALEIGSRGKANSTIRENITRFSIGLSMNARWFEKRKYD